MSEKIAGKELRLHTHENWFGGFRERPQSHLQWGETKKRVHYWVRFESRVATVASAKGPAHEVDLEPYFAAFDAAEYIFALKENWDDAGSRPYMRATFDKARTFVLSFADRVFRRFDITIPAPRVGHGPDGSIDLHWKTDNYELLVEVPESGDLAEYYGDNSIGEQTKGKMSIGEHAPIHGLLLWLTQS